MNEYVSDFQRRYAEKLSREEYAKELKQMRMVRTFPHCTTSG
jgi:hypothetical protein